MRKAVEIKDGIYWVGEQDPELRLFDDLFPTEHGTSYNSYLIKGRDKIALVDTVEHKFVDRFMDKLKTVVDPALIDYIIVNHTEQDHSGSIAYLLQHAPNATIVCGTAAKNFLSNQLRTTFPVQTIKHGDTLDLGGRTLRFIVAPFLHWPDTIFTRLEEEHILFSCDAFAAHYCEVGKIFNDEVEDFTSARHFYFDCIFRPFKDKVLSAVELIRHDVIDMICPSHGPIIRKDPWRAIEQFESWSKPRQSSSKKLFILYISPHGNTEKMSEYIAEGALEAGNNVDVIRYHISNLSANELRTIMEDADALVFGIPTINRDIPKPMWDVLAYLSTVKLKTNIAGLFGSYGWSGEACKMAEDRLKGIGFKLPLPAVRVTFTPNEEAIAQCKELGRSLAIEISK